MTIRWHDVTKLYIISGKTRIYINGGCLGVSLNIALNHYRSPVYLTQVIKNYNMSIQRIIEIPLEELKTGKGRDTDTTLNDVCLICGKPIKSKTPKMVHLLTNGNIVSYEGEDIEGDQGFFPVGPECEKKLVIKFTF